MNPGLLDDNQKKEARRLLEQIAATKKQPVILDDERMTLRRCWTDGAKIVAELNTIRAVHGRMQGVKNSEEITQGISDWVNQGRKQNGLD